MTRRDAVQAISAAALATAAWPYGCATADRHLTGTARPALELLGNRFFTFNSVVRVNQIETSRDVTNDDINYRFVQRGSGICGSDPDLEIRWFMNKDFRLALMRNWKTGEPEKVIDFTRYDLEAEEPPDPTPGEHTRNWSLMNRMNQKGVRPEDAPVPIGQLTAVEKALIARYYPELIIETR